MQNRIILAASIAALATLTGCNREPEVIHAGPADTQAADLAKAKPVSLPPSIMASRTYRCKDNSLIYVEFMSDQKTAVFHATKGGEAEVLTAAEPGKPYEGAGRSITGNGTQITYSGPGKGAQACKA